MPITARCGDGEAEYRCVRRFRHRRLLTMLWLQGFKATAESLLCESDAVFSVLRLRQLVEIGRWRDAIHYLSRFLAPGAGWPPSVEAVVLRLFLGVHSRLAAIVAGEKESPVCTQYLSHGRAVCHGAMRLRSILLNVLHTRQQLRVSMDWERVRLKAAEIVQNLGQRTPELKDLMYMPSGPMKPHNVVPIGFGFRRRYPLKKQASRPSASALAKHHLLKTRRLPAISGPSQESCPELLNSKALDWVADIVDECLKAGTHPKSHQLHPLQTSGTEGATVAPPASQTMFGSWAHPTVDRSMLPMENGGKLASHVTAPGAHFLGTVGAPFSGNKTSHREISGTTFLANAGAPVPPVSQIMNLKSHAGDSDVAPVLQNLSCSAETDQTPLVANAATMLDAPVPLTAVGCLTSTTKISGQSPMANNAGAPVVPAMQTMNLSTHAESSAISKCFDKEGRKNESAGPEIESKGGAQYFGGAGSSSEKATDDWHFW